MKKITIGVTDCSKYENYARWIQSYSPEIEIIKLSEKMQNLKDASRCNGILFTGGEDVHPSFYYKPEYLSLCHQDDINEVRDEFEMRLMQYTEANLVPVLGICRGLQIYNVYRGGTLIADIPTQTKNASNHAKAKDGSDSNHVAIVEADSCLRIITGLSQGEINSNHHQSCDEIGVGLRLSAHTPDGIIEALEEADPEKYSFLCLVQWHPERMIDQQSPLVRNIREAFIKEVMK